MSPDELIRKRFHELQVLSLRDQFNRVDENKWQAWATSVLNLFTNAFGERSLHFLLFKANYDLKVKSPLAWTDEQAIGIFSGAKSDYEGGYVSRLDRTLTGEVLGDFVGLAKAALNEGHKDVAAVLASAALEDALKRYARAKDLSVDDKVMQSIVNALKAEGLVSGAQKSLLDTMPKLRDYAMHANWEKLTAPDVASMIGFVEQFLLTHFS